MHCNVSDIWFVRWSVMSLGRTSAVISKSALVLGSDGQMATWVGMTRNSFEQVLLLSDCGLFQRESMNKWIEIPTFLLVYEKTTNNRTDLSILTPPSGINTTQRTFYTECQPSFDLHSRDTQHRSKWWSSLKNRKLSLDWEKKNLKHLPKKIITASTR